jgi:acetyl esterase/lipase
MTHISTVLLSACVLLLVPGQGATESSLAQAPVEIRLWDGTAPGSEEAGAVKEIIKERGTMEMPNRSITGVTVPTITVYRPAQAINTGAAFVICPGGGYSSEAIDKEGHDIARYFNTIGVTGIVLKYRLPRPEGFIFGHEIPLLDAARALRFTRHHADEWALNPDRIGVLGFSAGGHLASTLATRFDAGEPESTDPVERHSSRPDFQVLVYPVISFRDEVVNSGSRNKLIGLKPPSVLIDWYSNELQVNSESPPGFLVSTFDDRVRAENSVLYYQALRAAGVPVELHIYEVGGHGYGILPTGKPVATWHHRMADWMRQRGLLER